MNKIFEKFHYESINNKEAIITFKNEKEVAKLLTYKNYTKQAKFHKVIAKESNWSKIDKKYVAITYHNKLIFLNYNIAKFEEMFMDEFWTKKLKLIELRGLIDSYNTATTITIKEGVVNEYKQVFKEKIELLNKMSAFLKEWNILFITNWRIEFLGTNLYTKGKRPTFEFFRKYYNFLVEDIVHAITNWNYPYLPSEKDEKKSLGFTLHIQKMIKEWSKILNNELYFSKTKTKYK